VFKSTIYLSEALKRRVERLAKRTGRSEAEVIREALERLTGAEAPRPRGALFESGDPNLAGRVDELLKKGFGRS